VTIYSPKTLVSVTISFWDTVVVTITIHIWWYLPPVLAYFINACGVFFHWVFPWIVYYHELVWHGYANKLLKCNDHVEHVGVVDRLLNLARTSRTSCPKKVSLANICFMRTYSEKMLFGFSPQANYIINIEISNLGLLKFSKVCLKTAWE